MKPTLVLMPGMDGTGTLFEPLIAELSPELACVTIAYPTDITASYDELLPIVRSRLPEGPYVLVAESFSGPLAIMLAASKPAGLCGVVLCASFARSPLGALTSGLLPMVPRGMFRLQPPAFVITSLLVGRGAPALLITAVRRAIQMVDPAVLYHRLHALARVDVLTLAARIEVPALYLQAARDRLVRRSATEAVRAAITHIEVVTLPGPHLLLQRCPTASAEVIRNFVSQATT